VSKQRTIVALAISSILTACGGGNDNLSPEFEQASYSFVTAEDSAVEGSVLATDTEAVNYTVANAATNGVFALNADGSFTYTPSADFNGSDSVSVQASDGEATSQVTVNFNVSAINDAPVLTTTELSISTSGEAINNLNAIDADSDTVTFTLVQAPEEGTLTLSPTGEVTYQTESLEAISGSFVVSYTDGVIAQSIEATIDLKAALVTNADKLNYYYSSTASHLEKSENIKSLLVGDVARDEVNIDLISGYYVSGFDVKAESLLKEIASVQTKASAYQAAATALDRRGNHDKAADLRALAVTNYNIYLTEKGLANLANVDASFYLGLYKDYRDVNQYEEAAQLMSLLKLYVGEIAAEEYSTTYGKFLTVFNSHADASIEAYFADRNEENLANAIADVQHYVDVAENAGLYQYTRSGDYEDQFTNQFRALHVTWATDLFYSLNAVEQAKKYTALALSYYGITGFDDLNVYEASEYSDATVNTYAYPLELLSGIFPGLYPDAESNEAYNLVLSVGSSNNIKNATASKFSNEIVNNVIAGMPVTEAIQPAIDYFTADEEYKVLYQALVEYNNFTPRAASVLYARGEFDAAATLLNSASDILTSTAYVDDVKSTSTVTGFYGCNRLTDLQAQYGGDAQAQALKCKTLVDTHYTTEAGKFSASSVLSAHNDLMNTLHLVNDQDNISTTADNIIVEAGQMEDVEDAAAKYIELANYLNKYQLFDKSAVVFDSALASLDTMIASDDVDLLEDALELINDDLLESGTSATGTYKWNHTYVHGIKYNAANITDYAAHYASETTDINSRLSTLTENVLALTDGDVEDMMDDLVTANFNGGQYDQVTALVAHSVNAEADQLDYNIEIASLYALHDDLPSSDIASVDTDHDGLPNFFIADVTAEQITASGFTLDEDSDNDGINDVDDVTPLGS